MNARPGLEELGRSTRKRTPRHRILRKYVAGYLWQR
jgi:hypothetical protein